MPKSTSRPAKAVFSDAQLNALNYVLDPEHFAAARRGLEAVVKVQPDFTRYRVRKVRERESETLGRRASQVKVERLLKLIERDAIALLSGLVVLKRARGTPDLPHLVAEVVSGERRKAAMRLRLDRLERDLRWLVAAAAISGQRARAKAAGKRGRTKEMPEVSPVMVGQVLADVGVKLKRGARGTWAAVTAIVYEAQGHKPPGDLKRELIKAYPLIQRPSPPHAARRSKKSDGKKARIRAPYSPDVDRRPVVSWRHDTRNPG